MTISKENIAHGVVKFIRNDVIASVPDNSMKIILGIAAAAIETNPSAINSILDNEMVSAFIASPTGNGYDLSTLEQAAAAAMDQYGSLSVQLPGIPLISPEPKILSFGSGDVRSLIGYIEGRL